MVDVQAATVCAVQLASSSPSTSRIIGPGPGDDAVVIGDVATVAAMLAPYVGASFVTTSGRPLALAPLQVVLVLALTSSTTRVVTTDGAFDVVGTRAAVAAALNLATPPGPGPSSTPDVRRRDYSVNGARVDAFQFAGLSTMRTSTQVNAAGGFNGGGTGNKATLGHWLEAPLRLDALSTITLDFQWLEPESPMVATNRYPYVNLVVQLQPGDPSTAWAVFVVLGISAIEIDGLTLGTWTPGADQTVAGAWSVASDYVQVVNDVGMSAPPAGPVPVPVVEGPPVGVGTWAARAFALADILVAYPDATIQNGKANDGGTAAGTPIAGVTCSLGDSANTYQNAGAVLAWTLNGSAI